MTSSATILGTCGADGWTAGKVFAGAQHGYTYDDIVFMPGEVSFEASSVDLSTQLTKNIRLNAPVVGGPLDAVTGADMAIALALIGGIGIIHRNQSVDDQVQMVRRVKRHVSGFLLEPSTLAPTHTLADYDRLREQLGVTDVVVTQRGLLSEKVLGLVSARDADLVEDRLTPLANVMTREVRTVQDPVTLSDAYAKLRQLRVGSLPIVDSEQRLVAMVSRADLKMLRNFPRMSRSLGGQLLVGAAVAAEGAGDWERARSLAEAGADVLCVDAIESNADRTLELIRRMKEAYPKLEVIAGPVASCRDAKRLVEVGADAVLAGSSTPATAVFEVAHYLRVHHGKPVIAAGAAAASGSSQMLKALALGASAVSLVHVLAGTHEAIGDYVCEGSSGSLPACRKFAPCAVPSAACAVRLGVDGLPQVVPRSLTVSVPSRGSVYDLVPHLLFGVRCGLQDLGLRTLPELHAALVSGELRMECRTPAAVQLWEASKAACRQAAHREVMPAFASMPGS